MLIRYGLFAAALAMSDGGAQAEVRSAAPHGFTIEQKVNLVVPPAAAWRSLGQIGSWWAGDHTYSGSAANLSLELRPGGCFCERLEAGGGVEHMRVAYVEPGKRVVLTGALGPLLYEAVSGVMDLKVERIAGGSTVSMSYKAGGFASGGADKLAPAVDKVLAEQMKRLRTYATANDKKL